MTGPERIESVFFKRRMPDRVPWMEQAIASDVASAILGRKADTGSMLLFASECEAWLQGEEAHAEWARKVRRDLIDFAVAMGIDAIGAPWCMGERPARKTGPGCYLFQRGDGSEWIWQIDLQTGAAGWKKLKGKEETFEDIAAHVEALERALDESPPRASDYDHLMVFRELAGDRIEILGSAFLSVPMNALYLTALVERPALIERYLEAGAERNILSFRVQAELGFRILNGGGDLAWNCGPIYSPETFRRLMMPPYRRKIEEAHRLGLKYIFRSDGNLWPLVDWLFGDIGCDGYGEIDCDAGMDLWRLHERFPDLILWGGLSCGKLLRLGRPDEVEEMARRLVDSLGRKGRLILGSSNTLMPGTPAENVLAIKRALEERDKG